jgi:UDP-N-acetylglucosamine transferase subunit ALG13
MKERIYVTIDPKRSVTKTTMQFFQSLQIFLAERPDIIITTGAGLSLSTCIIAKLFKKKIIFIESFSRVYRPSLFGRLVYPISNLTIVQWKPLLEYYKKGIYGGPILEYSYEDPIIKNSKSSDQIFVTVGTEKFDRLIREVDRLVEEGVIKEKVIAQIGYADYEPKNCTWFRFTSQKEFLEIIRDSKFIISHGGVGSILQSLKLMKTTIVVPRLKRFNECCNDHQFEITEELGKRGKIIGVYDLGDLKIAIRCANDFEISTDKPDKSMVAQIVGKYLKEMGR